MEYEKLATELLEKMVALRRLKSQKSIDESLHGETFILGYIAQHGGDVNPGEICQGMNVSTARIAAALNSLEKKGLITRQIDPNNRSKIIVDITREGQKSAEKHQKTVLYTTTKMLEFLGEQDAKEYIRIIDKLLEFHFDCKELT